MNHQVDRLRRTSQLPSELSGAGIKSRSWTTTRPDPNSGALGVVSPGAVGSGGLPGHHLGEVALRSPAEGSPAPAALTVRSTGDRYEREADEAARRVVRRSQAAGRGGPAPRGEDAPSRPSPLSPPSAVASGGLSHDLGASIERARGGGVGLPAAIRAPMEREFGADFHQVRLHADDRADRLSRALDATAFTTGGDIFFRRGAYAPGPGQGMAVIAHELAHVAQQARGLAAHPARLGDRSARDPARQATGRAHSTDTSAPCHVQCLKYEKSAYEKMIEKVPGGKTARGSVEQLFSTGFYPALDQYLDPGRKRPTVINAAVDSVLGRIKAIQDALEGISLTTIDKPNPKPAASEIRALALDDAKQEKAACRAIKARYGGPIPRGMTFDQLVFITRAGLDDGEVRTDADLAPANSPQNDPGNPRRLSGGQISEVTALDYLDNGVTTRRVFKPNEASQKAIDALPKQGTHTAYRVLAASRVEGLIAARFAAANLPYRPMLGQSRLAIHGGTIGTATDFSAGKEAMESKMNDTKTKVISQGFLALDPSDPQLKRQAANLQLLDIITGQLDRHMGNVMVSQDPANLPATQVSGIDNDFGFSHLSNVLDTSTNDTGKSKTDLPNKVDRDFARAVLELDVADFKAALMGLDDREITASLARLQAVKAHLQTLRDSGELVGDGRSTWDANTSNEIEAVGFGKNYMYELADPRRQALEAMKQDATLRPSRDVDGRWVIVFESGEAELLLYSSDPNGSDLQDLLEEAEQYRRDLRDAQRPDLKARRGVARVRHNLRVNARPNL